jgi:hypothetical protein
VYSSENHLTSQRNISLPSSWSAYLCCLLHFSFWLGVFLDPDDRSDMFLRNFTFQIIIVLRASRWLVCEFDLPDDKVARMLDTFHLHIWLRDDVSEDGSSSDIMKQNGTYQLDSLDRGDLYPRRGANGHSNQPTSKEAHERGDNSPRQPSAFLMYKSQVSELDCGTLSSTANI